MKRFGLLFIQVSYVVKAHKLRTAIAVVGVLLGSMALVIVQNLSLSMSKNVEEQVKAFGDRVFTVYARVPYTPGQAHRRSIVKTMKISDASDLLTINNVMKVAPALRRSLLIKYLNTTVAASVIGSSEDFFALRGLSLKDGRVFSEDERINRDKVAILGYDIVEDLFQNKSPIGESVYINNMVFEVIGTLNKKGSDPSGNSMDNIVIVPVETAMVRLLNRDYINELHIQIRNWEDYETVAADVTVMLRQLHKLPANNKNDFDIINPIDEQEMNTTLIRLASIVGNISAGIAFLIGAVGIFSLMLLIVNQRTVEVGIKRAIGATKKDVMLQFLMESGYVGIVGGASGIVVGIILSVIACIIIKIPITISFFGIALGVGSALFSGVIAGLYPAYKASRVVPVEALRL